MLIHLSRPATPCQAKFLRRDAGSFFCRTIAPEGATPLAPCHPGRPGPRIGNEPLFNYRRHDLTAGWREQKARTAEPALWASEREIFHDNRAIIDAVLCQGGDLCDDECPRDAQRRLAGINLDARQHPLPDLAAASGGPYARIAGGMHAVLKAVQ
jgi:hypothetical protein